MTRTIETLGQSLSLDDPFFPAHLSERLLSFVRLFRECGDVFPVRLPGSAGEAIAVCHPDLAAHILVRKYQSYRKGQGYGQMRLLLGNGVITLDGDRWRQQRRILQPVYARAQAAERLPALAELPNELATSWLSAADRGEFVDVTRDVSQLTFSLIMTLLCGDDYQRIRGTAMEDRFSRIATSSDRDLDFVHSFAMPVRATLFDWIERRVENGETHNDLLHVLIAARDPRTGLPMAEEQILDECLTFIVAGVETTATTLSWLWYYLAQSPEAELALLAELARGSESFALGSSVAQLPYIRQVVYETMRLFPPVWVYPRIALEDDLLNGVPVRAGANVLIVTYLIHRHPDFWNEPQRFCPDRFAGDAMSPAFLPFSLGPRRCSGEDYSLALMDMILRTIVPRLALQPSGDPFPDLVAEINLRPARSIRLRPQRRVTQPARSDDD